MWKYHFLYIISFSCYWIHTCTNLRTLHIKQYYCSLSYLKFNRGQQTQIVSDVLYCLLLINKMYEYKLSGNSTYVLKKWYKIQMQDISPCTQETVHDLDAGHINMHSPARFLTTQCMDFPHDIVLLSFCCRTPTWHIALLFYSVSIPFTIIFWLDF